MLCVLQYQINVAPERNKGKIRNKSLEEKQF